MILRKHFQYFLPDDVRKLHWFGPDRSWEQLFEEPFRIQADYFRRIPLSFLEFLEDHRSSSLDCFQPNWLEVAAKRESQSIDIQIWKIDENGLDGAILVSRL